jgi:hypothetical protein
MMVVMVMRGRKGRGRERKHAAEEEELLHDYQNGTNEGPVSLEF